MNHSAIFVLSMVLVSVAFSAIPIPAKGTIISQLSDDFEDVGWAIFYSGDSGSSSNGKWYGGWRGIPRNISRVATPAGGLEASTGAISLRTTGQDDQADNQDDILSQPYSGLWSRLLNRSDMPSFVVRVWIPDFSTWNKGHSNLGFRIEARSNQLIAMGNPVGWYYPSIWLWMSSEGVPSFVVRLGDGAAPDIIAAPITQAGWWSLGICFDEQGIGYYYRKQGVGDFTETDKIWDTTNFTQYGGTNPKMDYVAYNFFSLGFPINSPLTPNFVVDDYSTYYIPVCVSQLKSDIDGPLGVPDCKVDFYDFAAMAADWAKCSHPYGCD